MSYLKRLNSPNSWKIKKKEHVWITRLSPGAHKLEFAVPLAVALRDLLGYANNLKEAKKVIDRQGFTRILIVSDPLHMKRAVTIARDLGINAYPSTTPTSRYRTWRSKLGFLLREAYFYASYLLRRPFIHYGD